MSLSSAWHQIVNATSIEIEGAAVLLTGAPGSGKSDLALRLIERGASLIADDVTELCVMAGGLQARFPTAAPGELQGRMEVRGLGIMPVRFVTVSVPLILVAELVAPEMVERMPPSLTTKYGDFDVALVKLTPFEASAVAKLRLAVAAAGGHIMAPL
jgi:serine kinase of HPr protein (carbohydrate metabolism regulator)